MSRAARRRHFKTSSTGDENAPTIYTVSRARKQHASHAIVHCIYTCQNYWSPFREIETDSALGKSAYFDKCFLGTAAEK